MKGNGNRLLLSSMKLTANTQVAIVSEKIAVLSIEELQKTRDDGGWSISQCLEHLNTYFDFYLPEIEKAVTTAKNKVKRRTYKSGWLGTYLVNMMSPKAKLSKYKAAKRHLPISMAKANYTVDRFISNTEILIGMLEPCLELDLNQRIKTSITPLLKLKLGDAVQFLLAHNERHIKQALDMID